MSVFSRGAALISLPTAPTFSMPSLPAVSTGTTAILRSRLVQAFDGQCRFRPWVRATVDGVEVFANGWDRPWYADPAKSLLFPLGGEEPTTLSGATTGASGWLADTYEADYRVCYRNTALGKETAPQEFTVTNSSGGTRNVLISDSGSPPAQFDVVAIYRATRGTGTYFLVAEVAPGSMPYTDTTTDATLRLNRAYVRRYRTTFPPIFVGVASFSGVLFGFTGEDSNLWYSQRVRADSEWVVGDFQDIPVQIGALDNYGAIRSVIPTYTSMLVFKDRATYELLGSNASDFDSNLLFDDRGCIAARCAVAMDNLIVALDIRGVYRWTPGAEPTVAGAEPGSRESPLAPIWSRMNLDAAHLFQAVLNEIDGTIEYRIALDDDPVPGHTVIYDYRRDRFVSVDSGSVALASGYLQDAAGRRFLCHADDLGYLWQTYVQTSEGVDAGDLVATVDGVSGVVVTMSGASLDQTVDGPLGSPVDVYSAAGELVEENRVIHVDAATTLEMLYVSIVTSTDLLAFGVIPALWEMFPMRFGTGDRKAVPRVFIEHRKEGAAATMLIDTLTDNDSWRRQAEIDLTNTDGRALVVTDDHAFVWSIRGSQRYAGMDFQLTSITFEVRPRPARAR